MYTKLCAQDRCASRRLHTGKTPIRKKLLAHLKPIGKTGGYCFLVPSGRVECSWPWVCLALGVLDDDDDDDDYDDDDDDDDDDDVDDDDVDVDDDDDDVDDND